MREQLISILLGTSGLSLALIISLALAFGRQRVAGSSRLQVMRLTYIAIALHVLHFSEEVLTGFYIEFPRILGLSPWPIDFFLSFNLACVAVWLLSAPHASSQKSAIAAIWFLAIASAVNFIAHPVLSFIVGGYFPGLWSSPIVGGAGVILIKALLTATQRNSNLGTK